MKTSSSEKSFNLVRDPWIPVSFLDGSFARVSLRDAFSKADAIRDLAVAPHERIAVMRLLICIAQAALDGPADDDPETWGEAAETLIPAAEDYLAKREPAFNLLGTGRDSYSFERRRPPRCRPASFS